MSSNPVLIAGGGIAGLLCGYLLARRGRACVLFEANAEIGAGCSQHAGGMLAPLSELDLAEPQLVRLGLGAADAWRALLGAERGTPDGTIDSAPDSAPDTIDSAPDSVIDSAPDGTPDGTLDGTIGGTIDDLFAARGSLLVAHRPEWPLLTQLRERAERAGLSDHIEPVGPDRIAALEPWLSDRLRRGLYIASEGVVHPERLLPALRDRFLGAGGVIHRQRRVARVEPGQLTLVDGQSYRGDFVIDCRGLGAGPDVDVRGVRGEYVVIRPHAISPTRPIRLMHPRYPLYIVPRPDGHLYIGATQIESQHDGPVQVRSALELLSALYSLAPAFADAEIERLGVGLRPAFRDNLPQLRSQPGLITLNGLFRHGYLLAPRLCGWALLLVQGQPLPDEAAPFWHPA